MTAIGVVLMYNYGNECEQNSISHWIFLIWIAVNVVCSEQILVLFFKTLKYIIQYRVVPTSITPILINKPPDLTMNQLYGMLTPVKSLDTQTDTCGICMDDEQGDGLAKLACGHIFHRECAITWLKIKLSCPTCRTELSKVI